MISASNGLQCLALFFNLIFKTEVIAAAQLPTTKASLQFSDNELIHVFHNKSNAR